MKLYEILENVEVQGKIIFAHYDYEKCERINLSWEQAKDKEIRYIYAEDENIILEVETEDE